MTSSLINTLCHGPGGVITIIGAGGKTSLMFRLARELVRAGKKVLTTTTTKIFFPDTDLCPHTIIAHSAAELIGLSQKKIVEYAHLSAGTRHDTASGKLEGLPPESIDSLWRAGIFDWIIAEADGSRQKPLKASAPHEPVIPESTACLVLVTGLDSVGLPLEESRVHRAEIFSDNTGLPMGHPVDESAIARSIAVEIKKAAAFCSARDHVLFLNKADTQERMASGIKIKNLLKGNDRITTVMIASLTDDDCIKKEFS